MNKVINELLSRIANLEYEVERLTAESTEWESKCYKYQDIIKEVREWANKTIFYFDFEEEITKHAFDLLYTKRGQELLKILDKENK